MYELHAIGVHVLMLCGKAEVKDFACPIWMTCRKRWKVKKASARLDAGERPQNELSADVHREMPVYRHGY